MSDTMVTLLISRLEEKKSSIEQFLARGGVSSYEDYMKLTGYYEAINEVIEEVKEIEKRFIDD